LGKLSADQRGEPLTPFTAVIGKNGVGKSTLFDAFGFVADCLNTDVETACDAKLRGGFERMRSLGVNEPIHFDIYYRDGPGERAITYELAINLDEGGRPFVESEVLKQRRKGQKHGRPFPFLRLHHGVGKVWAGEDALEAESSEEDNSQESVELTDPRQLGIATLGTLKEHPRIKRFRDFLKDWYLSYFHPDAARSIQPLGAQRHLNIHGDNIGNVVQYLEREHKERFQNILNRIAKKIPGVTSIDTKVTDDKRVLIRFNDGAFSDPFYASQMSDGTLKIFAYLLLMEDPEPPPFICIEEPENGLYHRPGVSFWRGDEIFGSRSSRMFWLAGGAVPPCLPRLRATDVKKRIVMCTSLRTSEKSKRVSFYLRPVCAAGTCSRKASASY